METDSSNNYCTCFHLDDFCNCNCCNTPPVHQPYFDEVCDCEEKSNKPYRKSCFKHPSKPLTPLRPIRHEYKPKKPKHHKQHKDDEFEFCSDDKKIIIKIKIKD